MIAAVRRARLAAVALGLMLFLAISAMQRAEATTLLTRAVAVESDAAQFPDDAAPREVSLPDRWARSRPEHGGAVWYRLPIDARPAEGDLLGVLIERVCADLDAFVNGQRVYSGGSATAPLARNCYRPQHFTVPRALLRPSANTLDIRVAALPLGSVTSRQRAGALSPVLLGAEQDVAPAFARALFWQVTLPQVVVGTLLLLGGFIALLGVLNRRASHLLFFGGMCLAWVAMSSRLWVLPAPLDPRLGELLVAATVPVLTLCAVQFLLRDAMWRHRVIDVALIVQCIVMPLSLLQAGAQQTFTVASAWYAILAGEVCVAIWWHLKLAARRRRRSEHWPMALLLVAAALLIGVEFAAQQDWLDEMHRQLLPFALPAVFALLGARLLWQHARALQDAESGQRTLESRVREATVEIERNFKLMAEMRVEQVTLQERKRIAADLHDDLGAKLLTIVHTSADDRISTLAREALEEMRLSVRGLTGKPVRLADALGDWRAELVSRLAEAGVESEWRAPAEEMPQMLAARAYVQTTRILREAVSNVIKHSGASRCMVAFAVADGDVQLVVQDNGRGIPMELDGKLDRGHGMAGMKHRAKQLHGQCLVESGPGYGTVIRLTLPLERHVAVA